MSLNSDCSEKAHRRISREKPIHGVILWTWNFAGPPRSLLPKDKDISLASEAVFKALARPCTFRQGAKGSKADNVRGKKARRVEHKIKNQ